MIDFGSIFWMFISFISIIVSVTLFLVHEFVLLPRISRDFRKAKWSKGVIAMIQDLSGNVRLTISRKELPEGVVKTKLGWYLLPVPGASIEKLVGTKAHRELMKQRNSGRGRGRPPKNEVPTENAVPEKVPALPKKKEDLEDYAELFGLMVHIPILSGLNKQIFFGSMNSPALSNLFTLAHTDLLKAKGLVPWQTTKTQLDTIESASRREGMLMMGGDVMRWIFYVIIACIPIAIIALCFWFLTQGGA